MVAFRRLAVATTVLTFLLIGLGGLVRATGSGDACPGWPLCGTARLPTYHAAIELSHRAVALLVGLVGLALLGVAVARFRRVPQILWGTVGAAVAFLVQAVLGGIRVLSGPANPWLTTAHLATSMLLFGALVYLVASSYCMVRLPLKGPSIRGSDPGFTRLARITAGATFALLLVGAYTRGEGGPIADLGWPLVNGRLVPALEGIVTAHFLHRVAAAAVGVLLLVLVARAWTMANRALDLVLFSTGAAALFLVQAVVGAATIWTDRAAWTVVGHVTVAALIWGLLVALATVSKRLAGRRPAISATLEEEGRPAPARSSGLRDRTTAYFQLTKPRIIELLLVTTVPAMILAADGLPSLWLVAATVVGGTLAAGGANAINCYLDRDIDEVMYRTRLRPLPRGRVSPENALTFGLALGATAFFLLGTTVNVLAAALAVAALLFYVFVYTVWLKRRSPQNIVIGGAAGAVPVLVGWAAVTGTVGLPAWALFLIVFLWTPPHFWALSLRHEREYASAGVPMLPVVRGREETVRSILRYSVALAASTLLLVPAAHMGAVYVVAAVVLGLAFVARAARLRRAFTPALAWGLFRFSIAYLGLLFAAVAADRLVRIPIGA
ncbi:MAG: protoheme IX farnesyltransferase [Actinobacteria bacterium]|nr:protoheme IX farnesyltransferase [Actinomycetota bacterium]